MSLSVPDWHLLPSGSPGPTCPVVSSEAGAHLPALWPCHEGAQKVPVQIRTVEHGEGVGQACCRVCSVDPRLGLQAQAEPVRMPSPARPSQAVCFLKSEAHAP